MIFIIWFVLNFGCKHCLTVNKILLTRSIPKDLGQILFVGGFFVCDLESQNCYLAILRIEDILPLYACVDKKIVFKYFFWA